MSAAGSVDPGVKLAQMANQIATFFRSYPEEEAVAGIHQHIVDFWSPIMRRQLVEWAGQGRADLDPLVVSAVAALAALGSAASPTRRVTAGPVEAGQLGASDAG